MHWKGEASPAQTDPQEGCLHSTQPLACCQRRHHVPPDHPPAAAPLLIAYQPLPLYACHAAVATLAALVPSGAVQWAATGLLAGAAAASRRVHPSGEVAAEGRRRRTDGGQRQEEGAATGTHMKQCTLPFAQRTWACCSFSIAGPIHTLQSDVMVYDMQTQQLVTPRLLSRQSCR